MSAAQLRAAGLTREAIAHRARNGRLTRLHRGVYLAGPIASPYTPLAAALLACGPAAALSHRTAAALWELQPRHEGLIDVTVTSGRREHEGVRVHRATLRSDERAERNGVALTTPARTLIDLAAVLPRRDTERALEQALVRRLTTLEHLLIEIHAARSRRGTRALRAIAEEVQTPSLTRSEAERRLLDLVRRAHLPHPVTNTRVGRFEVDLLWARERLVVEVDGYAFHGGRQAFERDRERDAELQLAGHRVLRVTWRQITDEPHRVVARLARGLSRGSGS